MIDLLHWNLGLALESLRTNRSRSALATLGITIGIASVIVMAAIGQGLSGQISGGVNALGGNLIYVFPADATPGVESGRAGRLSMRDIATLSSAGGDVVAVSGQLRTKAVAQVPRSAETVDVVGVDGRYYAVSGPPVGAGRGVTESDVRGGRLVATIDAGLNERLYQGKALGRALVVSNRSYTVIGITESEGGAANGTVTLPISTMRARIPNASRGPGELTSIFVRLNEAADPVALTARVTDLLKRARRIDGDDPLPLQVTNSAEFAKQAQGVLRALQAGLVGIAGISLLVGAIGVMNVMLVAVTERTREIGLRLAIGAQPSDILHQFLAESAVLCFLGGLIGVLLGLMVSAVLAALSGWSTWPSPVAVLMAVVVAVLVGMAAGYLPARGAARLQPIVAIRQD